jgi:hypothetical protein
MHGHPVDISMYYQLSIRKISYSNPKDALSKGELVFSLQAVSHASIFYEKFALFDIKVEKYSLSSNNL